MDKYTVLNGLQIVRADCFRQALTAAKCKTLDMIYAFRQTDVLQLFTL